MSSPFETEEARLLNDARRDFLEGFLADIAQAERLTSALDIGCGALGVFSRVLRDAGLHVVGMDARPENVSEAKRRNPDIEFLVQDVEDESVVAHSPFDFVLCFGLLYHLENPFLAIRNLWQITGKYMLIETQVAPMRGLQAGLYEEYPVRNQGMRYMALMPSELAVVKMLYKAGYGAVYEALQTPDHWQFRPSLTFQKIRTVLLASKVDEASRSQGRGLVGFRLLEEPSPALLSLANWETGLGRVVHRFGAFAGRISRRLGWSRRLMDRAKREVFLRRGR